jgi:hypothetical protein
MNYFIGLLEAEETNSELITPDELKQQLLMAWHNVSFETAVILNDAFSLRWSFEIGKDLPLASLHKDGETVSIDGTPESVAKFAVWYRGIISTQHKLCIFHDSSDEVIELCPQSTETEILDALYSM